MPWHDWQFWTVTLAALWGAQQLLRQLIAKPGSSCGGCATGSAACARAPASPEAGEKASPLIVLGER